MSKYCCDVVTFSLSTHIYTVLLLMQVCVCAKGTWYATHWVKRGSWDKFSFVLHSQTVIQSMCKLAAGSLFYIAYRSVISQDFS